MATSEKKKDLELTQIITSIGALQAKEINPLLCLYCDLPGSFQIKYALIQTLFWGMLLCPNAAEARDMTQLSSL